jgi:signal transduction histidine kinase
MFSEMLKEGWVNPEKQREYYTYISEESERLSRLIANVLQLARMERQDNSLDIKPHSVRSLLDLVRSRSATQLERAGFQLNIEASDVWLEKSINVDADAFLQIMLNLIDNALKFATQAEKKQIDVRIEQERDSPVIYVRDYGPGIPPEDIGKIFDLFYRIGNELTRETKGTGIGLALVRELIDAMGGRVSVVNRHPGAEFRLLLNT